MKPHPLVSFLFFLLSLFLIQHFTTEIVALHQELVDDSQTAAALFKALEQTLRRRVCHLVRFDSILRNIFDSEGERPLIGTAVPDEEILLVMMERLDLAISCSAAPEKWMEHGLELLKGQISDYSPAPKSLDAVTAPTSEDVLEADQKKVEDVGALTEVEPPAEG